MTIFENWLIERAKKSEHYFKNYLKYASIIKKEAEKIVGNVEGYVFGSILKKKEIPGDIDILLISPLFKDYKIRRKVRVRILEKLQTFWPFEIHLITPEQYNGWYRYFIKKKKKI